MSHVGGSSDADIADARHASTEGTSGRARTGDGAGVGEGDAASNGGDGGANGRIGGMGGVGGGKRGIANGIADCDSPGPAE